MLNWGKGRYEKMALREELEVQGNWLFRWRSYIPLIVFPILIIALRNSGSLERIGHTAVNFYDSICIVISFVGLAIRCITVGYAAGGTSGRNTKGQRAETLNTMGMYSIVRHPLYLGNFMISVGIVSFVQVWWFVVITVLAFWIYYERIMYAEEAFLRKKFGTSYTNWAERTPAFIPRLRNWQRPSLPVSLRNVLKRECSGFFGIIASFTLLDIARSLLAKGTFALDLTWVCLFIVGVMAWLVVRILRKRARIFHD